MNAASCAILGLALALVTPPAAGESHVLGTDPSFASPEFGTGLLLDRSDVLDIRVRHLDLDAPRVIGGTLGYRFHSPSNLDLELEAYHFAWDAIRYDARAAFPAYSYGSDIASDAPGPGLTTMSFNARYRLQGLRTDDFPEGRLQPYAGVGVGTFFQNMRSRRSLLGVDETLDEGDAHLGFQGFLGSEYFFSPQGALFAQYKLRHTPKLGFDLGNSEVELGLRANEWTSFELDLGSDEWRGEFKLNF